jgi:hypothetical protein
MERYIWDVIADRLKHIFSLKRTKLTLYIAIVLWLAVITQMFVNSLFREELQITEAFVKSETEEMKSSLEIAAEYKAGYLSDTEKRDLIHTLADSIGLVIDDDIKVLEEDKRSELYYYKQAKQASTEIKVVDMEQQADSAVKMKYYIIVRLNVLQGIQSIDSYKKKLEHAFDKMPTRDKQITLKYEGTRNGSLTGIQKHNIASLLVDGLQGEIALEYDEGDIYTVYAYTGMLNEYITTMGNKINIQIAITYNELTNKTTVTLASPILNESW